MLEQLIGVLRREGLDPTAEELADALWLLSRIGPRTSGEPRALQPSPGQGAEPTPPPVKAEEPSAPGPFQLPRGQRRGSIRTESPASTRGGTERTQPSIDVHQPVGGAQVTPASRRGVPFWSPRASALPEVLELGRALRPLNRRVPSRAGFTLDEEATARSIAEKVAFPLVRRPRLERWLDVVLVVDEGPSMAIWQRTVRELQSLLERHGAFRQVRRVGLLDDGRGALRLVSTSAGAGWREVRRRELLDPGGRRLYLLVSDCISACWEDGRLADWLQDWARRGPVAVVQVLPERLWHRSGLGVAEPVRLRAPSPAASNLHLRAVAAGWDEEGTASPVRVPLPVLEFDRGSIEPWAKLVAWSGGADIGGVVLRASAHPREAEAGGSRGGAVVAGGAPLTARERVARFRATASPRARQLAALFAAANFLSLPVMWQIRQVLLPAATSGNLAEVFLGGLLREASPVAWAGDRELVRYDFFEGVRELLLDAVDGRSAVRVLELVSDYVTARLGYVMSFRALLMDPTRTAGDTIPERERPFARLGASVLTRLGGEYARQAERLVAEMEGRNGKPVSGAGAPASSGGQPVLRARQPLHGITDESILTLEGHQGSVNACVVLPDGQRVLSASDDGVLALWDLEQGRVLTRLRGHARAVLGCAFTPYGQHVVSASWDWTLKVWTLKDEQPRTLWTGHHQDWVRGCAVTPDGRRVVSASDDWTLKVWELKTGQVLATLAGHERGVWGCTVTPDGRRVVSASEDKTLKVWELETGRTLTTLMGHGAGAWCCAVTPDGKQVVSASGDGLLKVWDLETGQALRTLSGHTDAVLGCAVTPDGRRVVSACRDGMLKVWDLETGKALRTLSGHTDAVLGCAVTPDGRRVVSVSDDWTLKVWELG